MPGLLDKQLLFVTGKGGVGKTSIAAALALAAAREGKRVVICEVAKQERIARTFGHRSVGPRETQIDGHLHAVSIDPQDALEEYLEDQLGSRRLASLLFSNRIFDYFTAAAPGARELVTIGKAWEMAQPERRRKQDSPFDLVVVDAPASGHGIGMLGAPRTYRDAVRMGTIARQAGTIDSFLTDRSKTGVVAVALAEEMPVNETIDLEARLHAEMGIELDRVFVNGCYPDRFTGSEAETIAEANGAHPALRAALWEHSRAKVQKSQVRRLRRATEAPVSSLPYLFDEDDERELFERLSAEVEKKL